ncbi:hypothetical protein COOONC_15805 [Cooperia oncophora]
MIFERFTLTCYQDDVFFDENLYNVESVRSSNEQCDNIAALRYVAAVCPTVQAVVKLDDDVAWNIQGTKSVVDESIKDGRIRCMKHVTEEEYSGEYFPPHCLGFAYVMPRKAFWFILEATSEERFLWIASAKWLSGPRYDTVLTQADGVVATELQATP